MGLFSGNILNTSSLQPCSRSLDTIILSLTLLSLFIFTFHCLFSSRMAEQGSAPGEELSVEEPEEEKQKTVVEDHQNTQIEHYEPHEVERPFLATTHLPIRSETDLMTTTAANVGTTLENHPLIYSNPEFRTAKFLTPQVSVQTVNHDTPSVAPSEASVTTEASRKPSNARLKSEMEIRDQHYQKQKQYASAKEPKTKRLTDIDFEGILQLIGGCSYWQVIIYLIISVQQVPHAMFNLSVVYMMYQPDHWCKIPFFNDESFSAELGYTNYTWDQVLNSTIAFPRTFNKQRNELHHDQCHYFERDYVHIKLSPWSQVKDMNATGKIMRCKEWEYDKSVMDRTVVTEWNRVCDNNWSRAHVHMSYSLGYLVGCFVGGFVSDRYGRKTAITLFGVLTMLFGFLLTYSKEFEIFLVVRFLLAATNEAADLAAYVLCMEVTGTKYRSIVGSLIQAPWACGYAFLALIAYLTKSWTMIHLICVLLHIVSLMLLYFLPESPRWLILNNKTKKAEKIIREACHYNNSRLPSDLGLVRHAEKKKWMRHNEKPSYFHLFRSSELRFRNIVLFIVWIATALVYYGMVIALSDQSSPGRRVFDGNFFLNNAMAGAIELPTLVFCVFLLRMGRKRSQMLVLFGSGLFLLTSVVMVYRKQSTLALIFMLLSKACIQGSFNILYIFTSELNPTVVRNSAVGISSMVARMGAGASGYIAILSDVTMPLVPMTIFACFSLLAGCLVLLLPETQGLPLPDTILDSVQMVKRNHKPCGTLSGTFLGPVDEDTQPYGSKFPRSSTEEDEEESDESIPQKTA
ncbi:CRE-OCT-2 protein [Caenorhabditis remanei]|uniref:CRE-OCT-2 protein n=1 Tax=Caenorhabditis remanei TaxID=31234 RepID=E3M2Z8_CAERE|nr:CRE-OCT-2 protein [Caenorhabditis remanei]